MKLPTDLVDEGTLRVTCACLLDERQPTPTTTQLVSAVSA